ncbi:MAG: hypothetical protein FJZ97_06590 [Chloroflexi bacterium]|nr:hypothetical protein [Chloroflexota bacterium]
MQALSARARSLVRSPDAVFAALWIASLLAGVLVFRDFGLAWDEPLFYRYSDAVGYAYSIPEWLSGSFDLTQAYGPSAEDHKIYGAAYLLIARNLTGALRALTGLPAREVWHLTNFLAFELGVLFFYRLCRRWLQPAGATMAAMLYLTQPVVWGHAFINPKDMPFATLFILTLDTGFRMVDRLTLLPPAPRTRREPAPRRPVDTRWLTGLGLALGLAALLMAVFGETWRGALGDLVRAAFDAPAGSDLGSWFSIIARSRGLFTLEYYLARTYSLYRWGNFILGAAALGFLGALWARRFPQHALTLSRHLQDLFSPPPSWPSAGVPTGSLASTLRLVAIPAILLGMLTAVRILGPFAAVLIAAAFLVQNLPRSWLPFLPYAGIAALVTLACWPYLWPDPLGRFNAVVRHMADNPQLVPVLFGGRVYSSTDLPAAYLPRLLGLTLTEPVWFLALAGLLVGAVRFVRKDLDWHTWFPVLAWFALPALYVLVRRPAMYDGYRHFLFILPPVFIVSGLALEAAHKRLRLPLLQLALAAVILSPGVVGLVRLHPYPYAYYNAFAGGVQAAFRSYETDYWLTCYKESIGRLRSVGVKGPALFVLRQPAIAREYASGMWDVRPFEPDDDRTTPGSLILLTTRSNIDQKVHPGDPVVLSVGRLGATFCVVKQVPDP